MSCCPEGRQAGRRWLDTPKTAQAPLSSISTEQALLYLQPGGPREDIATRNEKLAPKLLPKCLVGKTDATTLRNVTCVGSFIQVPNILWPIKGMNSIHLSPFCAVDLVAAKAITLYMLVYDLFSLFVGRAWCAEVAPRLGTRRHTTHDRVEGNRTALDFSCPFRPSTSSSREGPRAQHTHMVPLGCKLLECVMQSLELRVLHGLRARSGNSAR